MRIGLMIPAVNTVAEEEFHAGAPDAVSVHTARMHIAGTGSADVLEMVAEALPRATRDIADVEPDVVVLACTAVGAVVGPEREATIIEEIGDRTGAPVVSMNGAVHRALERQGSKRVVVLAPYPQEVTERMAEGVRAIGLTVPAAGGMGVERPVEIAAIEPERLLELARRYVPGTDADTVFVSCGNLRTRVARERLAAEFGVVAVSSNQAALDQALEVLRAAPDVTAA